MRHRRVSGHLRASFVFVKSGYLQEPGMGLFGLYPSVQNCAPLTI